MSARADTRYRSNRAASAASLARNRNPDLILMDIRLHGMDGLRATTILKTDVAAAAGNMACIPSRLSRLGWQALGAVMFAAVTAGNITAQSAPVSLPPSDPALR